MTKARVHDLRRIKIWCIAILCSILIGSASVAYAYSGEHLPKSSPAPMMLALAASFRIK
jgi:formate/nitrite transporter FocA (FNT family)